MNRAGGLHEDVCGLGWCDDCRFVQYKIVATSRIWADKAFDGLDEADVDRYPGT